MADNEKDINLNVKATNVAGATADLRTINAGIKEIAASSAATTAALGDIRSAMQTNVATSGDLKQVTAELVASLGGISNGVSALVDLADEAEKARERMAKAGEAARELREELRKKREELSKLKELKSTISEVITSPSSAAASAIGKLSLALGTTGVMAAGAGAALLALGGVLTYLTIQSANDWREIKNLGDRLDLSANDALKLRAAANLAGVDVHSLEFAARTLSNALEDTTGIGKRAAGALHDLGIAAYDGNLNVREMGPVLLEVLEKLSHIESSTQRSHEAFLLLGRGAKVVAPMIKDLTDLTDTVKNMRLELNAADQQELLGVNRRMTTLGETLDKLKRQIAADFSPMLIKVVETITRVISTDSPKTPAEIGNVDQDAAFERSFGYIKNGGTKGREAAQQAVAGANAAVTEFEKSHDGLEKRLSEVKARRKELFEKISALAKMAPDKITPEGSKQGEADTSEFKQLGAEEARIQAQLRSSVKDKAGAAELKTQEKYNELSVDEDRAYWQTIHENTIEGATEKFAALQADNTKITALRVKELNDELTAEKGNDRAALNRKAQLRLEIAQVESAGRIESVRLEAQFSNAKVAIWKKEDEEHLALARKAAAELERIAKQAAQAEAAAARDTARASEITENTSRRNEEAIVQRKVDSIKLAHQLGIISGKEESARLDALYADLENKERAHIEKEIADERALAATMQSITGLKYNNAAKVAELEAKLDAVTNRSEERRIQSQKAALLEQKRQIDQAFAYITRTVTSSMDSWIRHTKTFGQAFREMAGTMIMDMENALVKMALKWVQHQVMRLVTHEAANHGIVASDAVAAAERDTISLKQHIKQIFRDAIQAATGAYAATVKIPVVGHILAPIAAGVAFAGVMAFGALSAERGALLPNRETMVFAHPRESILPADMTEKINRMTSPQTGHNFQFSPTIHALDATGVDAVLERHGRKFIRYMNAAMKDRHAMA